MDSKQSNGVSCHNDSELRKRETWNTKLDFLLACIGFSVGLGNVWRFPYLCYKNGGGAFLIPYLICVVVGGIPLFYLEVAVGLGIATTITVFFLNCYYNVILAWAFYYFFSSFTSELPWENCGHDWNRNCTDNFTLAGKVSNDSETLLLDPVTEFWENKVLGITDGVHNMGTIKWDMALCLLLAWITVYLCICKGIKSSGRVMYVTATSPYIFMIVLLIRGVTLDGAADGLEFYIKPNITKLAEMDVWVDAGTQIFFSYSISLGVLTALGSYNKFNHNSYRDSIIFGCTNSGTSILAGFIIFPVLGFMAKEQNKKVGDVAESGPGLAFIAYPKAIAQMPLAPVWSVIFFLMIILLGLDSQFVGVEGVITAVVDQWPDFLRKGYRREVFIAIVCALSFFVGLSMVAEGGMYVFQLFDYYSGSKIILLVAFFELVAISWTYGIDRFYENIRMMLGWRIWPYMWICWVILSPAFCLAIFVMSVISYSELDYKRPSGTYSYPQWAVAIGWGIAGLSAAFVPIVAIYKVVYYTWKYGFTREVFQMLGRPYHLQEHQMRPRDYRERTLADLDGTRDRKVDLTKHIMGPL